MATVKRLLLLSSIAASIGAAGHPQGLTLLESYSPGLGTLVGSAFDPSTDRFWIYADFDSVLRSRVRIGGAAVSTVARPGESANDFDLEVTPVDIVLGTTPIPRGTLLAINGETGFAEVYALDKDTGAVLATLVTAFGVSHVVGGAVHPCRETLFLVADKNDSISPNRIAEVDLVTGAVLNTFGTGSASFTVNFGDLDVSALTGNVYLVSSDESVVRELDPTGVVVQDLALPVGVSGLSGIGLDDARGEAVLTGGSSAWRVGGFAAGTDVTPPVLSCPGNLFFHDSKLAPSGEVVTFLVTSTDDCDPTPAIVCDPPSGSFFRWGTTLVVCSATDGSGNVSQCSFTVTVLPSVRRH